ncbi:MAG: hypothetical protein H6744_12660 [Deltaproteobacteria bacterium]|nr:hypothetical protein [Deltaproteobacteria bacterium]MCB9787524.1 hypothetical protein [Deltaproteobacteria bacterium]
MRRHAALLTALVATTLACCAHSGTRDLADTAPPDAVSHFPERFPNVYLGMPMAEWRATHPDAPPAEAGTFDFRIVVVEPQPVPGVEEVTWYFDTDLPGQPLYEAIVDYGSNAAGRTRAIEALGPSEGARPQWQYATSMGYPVRVWAFSTKIVVAAGMPGTEWDGEW